MVRGYLALPVVLLAMALLMAGVVGMAFAQDPEGDVDAAPVEKEPLKYPNLGSKLNGLVVRAEEFEEELAKEAALHRGGSVAVTVFLSGDSDSVVDFLMERGGDPRNVGEDYIEAYVPVGLLGQLSEQTGVVLVKEIIPPEPD